jgi:hypothetical protein
MAVKKFDENSNSHEKLSARESTARTRVVITHRGAFTVMGALGADIMEALVNIETWKKCFYIGY